MNLFLRLASSPKNLFGAEGPGSSTREGALSGIGANRSLFARIAVLNLVLFPVFNVAPEFLEKIHSSVFSPDGFEWEAFYMMIIVVTALLFLYNRFLFHCGSGRGTHRVWSLALFAFFAAVVIPCSFVEFFRSYPFFSNEISSIMYSLALLGVVDSTRFTPTSSNTEK